LNTIDRDILHTKRVQILVVTIMSIEKNKQIVLRFAQDGWGTMPNWEKVWDELVAPNLVQHFNSFPDPIVGLENNKRFSEELFKGMPDAKCTIEDVVAEGDLVVFRSTVQGTQTGTFLGYSATGKSTKLNDFTQIRIENGKIVEMWYETNLLSGLQQLGLAPA
jgi:predicted ester cyclase